MVRWMRANLNRGELDGHRILKDSTYDLMWKGSDAFRNMRVGISWFLTNHKGQQVVMARRPGRWIPDNARPAALAPDRHCGILVNYRSTRR